MTDSAEVLLKQARTLKEIVNLYLTTSSYHMHSTYTILQRSEMHKVYFKTNLISDRSVKFWR